MTDTRQSWRKLSIPGTAYYPRTIQADDGRIFVFGYVSADDPYGKTDQSIVMSSFLLVKQNPRDEVPNNDLRKTID